MPLPHPHRHPPPPTHFPASALDWTTKFSPLPRAAEMVCFYLRGGFLVRKTRATTVGSFGTKEREKEREAGTGEGGREGEELTIAKNSSQQKTLTTQCTSIPEVTNLPSFTLSPVAGQR